MDGDLFGLTVDGEDVERALVDWLELWMPDYLADAVRIKDPAGELWPGGVGDPAELGEPAVLPVKEFTVKHAAEEAWPAERLPMLLAYSPGFARAPSYEGDGTVTGYFLVNLSAIASGRDTDDTKRLGRLYASAAAKLLMQKPDLGGLARDTRWKDLRNMRPPGADRERNIMAVVNVLEIEVPSMMIAEEGPDEPSGDPSESPGERPEGKTVSADVRPGKAAVDRLREGGHFGPE